MGLTKWITFRSLSTRRMRTILTLFGIIIGVACIFAINFTNESAYRSITGIFEGTTGKVDLEIRSSANVGGVPDTLVDDAAQVPGVAVAAGTLKLPAALAGEDQTQIDLNFFGTGAGGLMLHGIDPAIDPQLRDYTITAGRFLRDGEGMPEVVLAEPFARDNELDVGDTMTILTAYGPAELKIVGLMAEEGAGLTNLGKFGVITLGEAQDVSRRPGEVDQVDLIAEEDVDGSDALEELRSRVSEAIGEDYAVVFPADQGDRMARMLSGYQIGLNFMAGIALFVGAFLIFNAFSMTVVERTREIGLLRAVGMSRRQTTGQVLMEGTLLGVSGAVLGVLGGYALAQGLMSLMSSLLGQNLQAETVSPGLLATSLSVGLCVTLLASYLPARQAGRISPLEALRVRGRQEGGWLDRVGWIAGLALLLVSGIILVWNPFPYDVQFRLGSLTVFCLFAGAMLVIPATLRTWNRLGRWLIRLLFGNLGDIGARNLERSRRRTMLTCAALMVGVSMIVTTQGMVGSFTADLNAWLKAYTAGDVFVSGGVPFNQGLQEKLEDLDGVERAAPVRYLSVTWLNGEEEETISLMAVEPDSYTQVTEFVFTDKDADTDEAVRQLAAGQAVFISGVIAEKYGLAAGDRITLKTRDGDQSFAVAAVILDFYNQGQSITGSWKDLERYFEVDDVNTFLLSASPDADIPELVSRINDTFEDEYQLVAESNRTLRERADALMGQAFSMFDILGILAVIVAALGVLNTLSMSVVERTREIGMLRSIGMTRWQVVRMVLAEAFMMGLIGGVLGLGFGLALTKIFLAAMETMSGYALDFVMPDKAIWLSLIVALATSQLAALLPAVKAARTPTLAAIHYE